MAQSQAFTLTHGQYLTDFAVTPALIFFASAMALVQGSPWASLTAAAVGYVAWVLSEYVTHRHVFHRTFRREHWAHHMRPASDIGVSPTYTVLGQVVVLGGLAYLGGWAIGGAAFAGYAFGYLGYLITHHAFHRWSIPQGHWLRPAYERHEWHHKGHEVNFNVLFPVGDRLFGTYYQPPPGVIG